MLWVKVRESLRRRSTRNKRNGQLLLLSSKVKVNNELENKWWQERGGTRYVLLRDDLKLQI